MSVCACTHVHTLTHVHIHSLGLADDQPALGFWLVGLCRPVKVLMAEKKNMYDATAGEAVWRSMTAPRIVQFL